MNSYGERLFIAHTGCTIAKCMINTWRGGEEEGGEEEEKLTCSITRSFIIYLLFLSGLEKGNFLSVQVSFSPFN